MIKYTDIDGDAFSIIPDSNTAGDVLVKAKNGYMNTEVSVRVPRVELFRMIEEAFGVAIVEGKVTA